MVASFCGIVTTSRLSQPANAYVPREVIGDVMFTDFNLSQL